MAVVRTLTDGTTSIPLTDIDAFHRRRKSYQGVRLSQAAMEDDAGVGSRVVENHRLNLTSTDANNAAAQLQGLDALLRKAFINEKLRAQYYSPVWLQEQAEGETGARYAKFLGVADPGMELPDLLADPFRALAYIEDFGLNLIREHPWRDNPPGTLPANPLTLADADGPANPVEVQLANFWDTIDDLTDAYWYDDSTGTWSNNLIGLLFNPGFEDPGGGGADIWANWTETAGDGALADETTLIHSGLDAAKLTAGATRNTEITQTITVLASTAYSLTFWTRGDGTNPGRYAVYDVTHGAYITAAVTTGVPGTTYTKVTAAFNTPAGCVSVRVELWCPNVAAGIAYFDDTSLWTANTTLLPAAPAVNDLVEFGFTSLGHHVVVPVKTAASAVWTLQVQYYSGAAFVEAPEGTMHTRWPTGTVSQLFNAAGDWVINVGNLVGEVAKAEHGVTKHWIRIKITAFTSCAQGPVLSDTDRIRTVRTPYLDIPASQLAGDAPPLLLLRGRSPIGASMIAGMFGLLSRLIIGSRAHHLDTFRSHLNLGNSGNAAACVVATGTDTTFVADPLYPGGYRGRTTFATDITEQVRLTVTLDDLLPTYRGVYRAVLRLTQLNGASGDCSVRVRIRIGGTTSSYPTWVSELMPLMGVSKALEWVDLGLLTIPFTQLEAADYLTATDVIVELLAKRTTGAAELYWGDLVLIPADGDGWWTELNDPFTDPTTGSSALRGDSGIHLDAGVVRRRCMKELYVGSNLVPGETWNAKAFPNKVEPGVACRLFVLMGHSPSGGFGNAPLQGTLGCHLSMKVYAHHRYHALRGAS